MPSIDIRRPHALPLAEARAIVDKVGSRMQEKFGMTSQWQGDTLTLGIQAFGQSATAIMTVLDDRVNASFQLPLFLAARAARLLCAQDSMRSRNLPRPHNGS